MDEEHIPEPPWTIKEEERFITVLLGLMGRFDEFKQFEQECVSLEQKRAAYVKYHFIYDWFSHISVMQEDGLPTHKKSQEIAEYWYAVGILKGVNLSTGIVDREMMKMPTPPEEGDFGDDEKD